jgi:hypothetical protein
MMEEVSTSKMSANTNQTARRNIPEDSHIHIHRHKNLKSDHIDIPVALKNQKEQN